MEIQEKTVCHHCGEECQDHPLIFDEHSFCCTGCQTVYEILKDNELCGYYDLEQHQGVSLKSKNFQGKFDYLLDEHIYTPLLDYKSDKIHKVRLYLPDVHCSSCVWLLENLHKIRKGVLYARLNFIKKELSITYEPSQVSLKELVELLSTLGYEPYISINPHQTETKKTNNRLLKQIAVTGFAMGNIMLMSFPEYFKLDLQNATDAGYQSLFLYLNTALGILVYTYGAQDYLKSAFVSLKEIVKKNTKSLSIDIPISLGITALFVRSMFETFLHHGGAYWDSMAGLVLFLLVGKWVQQKTFDYLAFEHTYKSYFPLAVKLHNSEKPTYKNVEELEIGDVIEIHSEELIPADAKLLHGEAFIDYAFVTGESTPETAQIGDLIMAGGRQKGGKLLLRVEKEVSKSYLTQIWNDQHFDDSERFEESGLSKAFSKYFTYITLFIALTAFLFWQWKNPALSWEAFISVLMVACPCALTLSMPFTMNTAMGILGKNNFFVRHQQVIQKLHESDVMVFDKTGTLTEKAEIAFEGEALTDEDIHALYALSSSSQHPKSRAIAQWCRVSNEWKVENFKEKAGIGTSGLVNEISIAIKNQGGKTVLLINQKVKGYFDFKSKLRPGIFSMVKDVSKKAAIYLLSGDSAKDQDLMSQMMDDSHLLFYQSPLDKLNFIKKLQAQKHHTIMVGDGLNDAGALHQSDVGIALTDEIGHFTPGSDVILSAQNLSKLPNYIELAKGAVNMVKISFLLSLVYNFICLSWAVSGTLSPLTAAIFMPLSSISVVLFAVLGTFYKAHQLKLLVL